MTNLKKNIANALLVGAIVALIAFSASLFLTKKWMVSGRIVVFPSGAPATAAQNLLPEVGNTAWIINSNGFQEEYFGNFISDFSGAEVVRNSSIVLVKFKSAETNIQDAEDLIVKIPEQVAGEARDLYSGSPFKYKLVGDPEVSARQIQPDFMKNSSWGFVGGLILYFIFWLLFDSREFSSREQIFEPGRESTEKEDRFSEFKLPEMPKQDFSGRKQSEMSYASEKAQFEPEPESREDFATKNAQAGGVPPNLPIADEISSPAPKSDLAEPTDDEVKDRLNKLMRGEL